MGADLTLAGPRAGGDLPRAFFARPVLTVARELLGCVVRHRGDEGEVAVRLTEVEAYAGEQDPGSHAFRGRTPRTEVMFGEAGHAYVYFSYGMHWCANLVCGPAGEASAVLLRAGEVVDGRDLARSRRAAARTDVDLARGPARLAQALGLSRDQNEADVCAGGTLRVTAGSPVAEGAVRWGPRVGVAGEGAATPWRCWVDGDPTVSAYRPAQPRRRRSR
ncbi:DNA-3-methyladenine glycosylase [Kineococcus xinjiangensis]|uniref:Putative 3-methyladenine DNA glycosylase n=1 Tax=Kineococcus xinjiangensis TaxID=512762 RepID=A0A2S6ILX7_9ACTN|nr:DNA-3-methyladenine glycosylase [Kineococcus xinjiangensis]PPK95181.1 DNA-3-methyladenine glycosylase [Kineococcus xinjiangensis]